MVLLLIVGEALDFTMALQATPVMIKSKLELVFISARCNW